MQANAIELLQINKAQTHHIESFQKQIQQQKDQINALTTQNAQLQKELGEIKEAKAITAVAPGTVVGSLEGGGVNEGIQAAVLSFAAAAVNLAQTIADNQIGVGATATTSISTTQPTAAPITTTRRNTKRNPSTMTGDSTADGSDSGDSRATVEVGTEATTTTSPENAPSSSKGSAITRIHRAVQSLMAFNDQQPKREDKWAINQSSLSRLTGANRLAFQKYLADHGQEIQAHNHSHGLTDFHNIAKGRAGQDIKAQIS